MTLRGQIQDAIDEVSPPAPHLERKATAYVFAGDTERKALRNKPRRSRWPHQVRGAVAVIAAALVIALLAGLILSGRVLRDLNPTPVSPINPTELKSLELKPLHLPSVAPGVECPVDLMQNTQGSNFFGSGPVHAVDGKGLETNDWGTFGRLLLNYNASAPGLVLIRAKDLQKDSEVAFAQYPLEPTGIAAVGPVLGEVHALNRNLELRSEAVFRDSLGTSPVAAPNLLLLVAVQKGSSRCIGFQFDGPGGFSESLILAPAFYLNT